MATSFLSFETRCCSWLLLALKQGVVRGFVPIYDFRWIDGERGVLNGRRHRGGHRWRASLVRQAGDRRFGRVAANARREQSTHWSGGGRCGGRIAVVVVVVLRQMLGASCQRIGAAAFVLLQMLGVRFDTSQRAATFVAAGTGAIGPVVVVGAKVTAEIRYGSDRDDRGEFVLAAGLAASGRACG
jgi:hypothetical protein